MCVYINANNKLVTQVLSYDIRWLNVARDTIAMQFTRSWDFGRTRSEIMQLEPFHFEPSILARFHVGVGAGLHQNTNFQTV